MDRLAGWKQKATTTTPGRRLAEDILPESQHSVRAVLLEHVLLTPCADNTWMAGHCLAETQLDLYPTNEDLAGVLKALRARAGDGALNAEMWRDLLLPRSIR